MQNGDVALTSILWAGQCLLVKSAYLFILPLPRHWYENGDEASPNTSPSGRGQLVTCLYLMNSCYILIKFCLYILTLSGH